MLNKLKLTEVGPSPSLELALAPRLNLLTGDNGLGKTFLLDVAWWALTCTWPGRHAWPDPKRTSSPVIEFTVQGPSGRQQLASTYDFPSQSWPLKRGGPPPAGLVLYARVDGGVSVWDPARNDSGQARSRPQDDCQRPPAYHFTADQIWDGLELDGRMACNGMIRDWVTWQDRQNSQFQILTRTLTKLSPHPDETFRLGRPTRVSLGESREIPTLEMPYGAVPITLASAGVQRVLALAYILVWSWSEHLAASELSHQEPVGELIFLFDEIEAHLHPEWQRVLVPALLAVLKALKPKLDVQLIANTHSPLVLASLEPDFDQARDALFHFALQGDQVVLTREAWRPRGDVSAWLTSEIFELGQARSLPAEQAIRKALEAFRQPNPSLTELRRIHLELHGVLKDTDPFWPRWLARAEIAGIEP